MNTDIYAENEKLRARNAELSGIVASLLETGVGITDERNALLVRVRVGEKLAREAESCVGIGFDHYNESKKLTELIAEWDALNKNEK